MTNRPAVFSSRQIIRFALCSFSVFSSCALAHSQVGTASTVSLSPAQVYQGTAPVATVTITAADRSSPDSTVSCSIQTRGHAASYSANVSNGSASISLSSISQVPVGTYSLVCNYVGSAAYAPSTTGTTTFQVLAATPTTTSSSLSSTQVVRGTTPVASVTVATSSGLKPTGAVRCAVRARGHEAIYGGNLNNGGATLSLPTLSQVPIGTYAVACSYNGASNYGASAAATTSIRVVAH